MNGIPAWAVRGAKVVCIDGGDPNSGGLEIAGAFPVTNGIYTIEKAFCLTRARYSAESGLAVIVIADFPNEERHGGWALHRFRPLVTRSVEEDIAAHFQHHLNMPELVE